MPLRSRKVPRRKAKQQRSRETVEAVLEAAAQVLVRDGYARASTNRIAERAGVSTGSLYQYFGSKDDVFEELIRRETEGRVAKIKAYAPDPLPSLEDGLRGMMTLSLQASRHAPEIFRELEHVPNAALRRRAAAVRDDLVAFVLEVLQDYRDQIRVPDLEIAAFVLVSASEGVAINASRGPFGERMMEELTTLFSRYLRGGAAPAGRGRG